MEQEIEEAGLAEWSGLVVNLFAQVAVHSMNFRLGRTMSSNEAVGSIAEAGPWAKVLTADI